MTLCKFKWDCIQKMAGVSGVAMVDNAVQIFISYSRDDNQPPPAPTDRKGFVEYLQNYLNHQFRDAGPLRPTFWRDEDQIADGEPFPRRLADELDKSAFLLVVLSQNWLNSGFCRQELEIFRSCRKARNEPIDERIILVEKSPVELTDRPAGLPVANGYRFYRLTERPVSPVEHFFVRGEPDAQYWQIADELFAYLSRAVTRIAKEGPTAPPSSNGRVVFVAKPASDMREHYHRLVAELTGKGYSVVPPHGDEIPSDGSAQAFIEAALAKAEVSIHLLGESEGPKPEGLREIVPLQLALAAARITASRANGGSADPRFYRIVWAPKIFQPDPRSGSTTLQRDPHDVLARLGAECDTDKIFGNDFGSFREMLVSYLDRLDRPADAAPEDDVKPMAGQSTEKLFVLHDEKDRDLARRLKRALLQYNVEVVLPVRDGDEVKRNALNLDYMRACYGVAICWGLTTEYWTRAQAHQFDSWRELGRNSNWEPRGIVLGPPLDSSFKVEFQEDGPPSEINAVVVVQDLQSISPDELRKLLPRRPPASS